MNYKFENITSCFLGLATGDALGVPVEFKQRSVLKNDPIKNMLGFDTWNQPPGTWSDDSSLTFCLAESLTSGYNLFDIGEKFIAWYTSGYWGAHHKLFDVGGATRAAIERIKAGEDPRYSGELDERSNGNGSLMRIIPAALYFADLDDQNLFEKIKEISSITHAHFRSVFSCFIFSVYAIELFKGEEKIMAFEKTIDRVNGFISENEFNRTEINYFKRLLDKEFIKTDESSIHSSGYVLHTLEACIWCILTTISFSDAVLKAVNLGEDTDTTACVTGALAGLCYGEANIPDFWLNKLARQNDIRKLSEDFIRAFQNHENLRIS